VQIVPNWDKCSIAFDEKPITCIACGKRMSPPKVKPGEDHCVCSLYNAPIKNFLVGTSTEAVNSTKE